MWSANFWLLTIFLSSPLLVNAQIANYLDDTPEAIKDLDTVTKNWKKLEAILKNLMNQGMKSLMPTMMDAIQEKNISSTCLRDGMTVLNGMRRLETWAMRFLDASAKGIDGLLTGTGFSYGSYDECVDTIVTNQRPGKQRGQVMFSGKYCMMKIKPTLPPKKKLYSYTNDEIVEELQGVFQKGTILSETAKFVPYYYQFSMRLGMCVPSGCSPDDINQLLEIVSNYTALYMKVSRCEVKENPKYTPLMIFVMCLYSFAGFIVLIGTIADIYCQKSERDVKSMPVRALLAFSLLSNFRKFTDTSTSSETFSCLNGIRFLTMSWVILGHTYVLVMREIVSGMLYARSMVKTFEIQVIMNCSLAVDTFFFIGGLLVCYVATKHVKVNNRKFIVKMFIFHRIWRILPTYIFVILFVFLLELLVSGPLAHTMLSPIVQACKNNWWTNLLFINNFYHNYDMCLPHSWYLALDMQYYIGSLIILLPLFRSQKVGIALAVVCGIGFMVSCSVISYLKDYGPTILFANPVPEQLAERISEFYMKPYAHGMPYIIGIIAGYFLALYPNFKISKVVQLLGWTTSIILSLSVLYGIYEWSGGRQPTMWETIFYSGFHRVAWTLSICWMVVCCAIGHGGVVNYILSWKMWIPLGRLTFIAYLVHPLVQAEVTAVYRTLLAPMHTIGVWLFFGHLIATYGIAFAGTMLIESPMMSLGKLIFRGGDQKTSSNIPGNNGNEVLSTDVDNGREVLSTDVDNGKEVLSTGVDMEKTQI